MVKPTPPQPSQSEIKKKASSNNRENQNEFDTFAVHRLNKCFKHCHSS
jgi:hypothetical protein